MSGLDSVISDLQKAIDYIEKQTPKILEDMAETAKKEIQAVTPVKTGKLKNSIQATIFGNKAVIDSSEDYADDVEYGHMQEERFVPVLDKMIETKFIKGYHMFENGMNNAESKLDRQAKDFIENLPIFK